MPFYEYQCAHCGHHLEAMQKISDAPLKKCPECGKSQLKRLISAPVFRLKGSGWYETDFKGDKDNKRNLHGADDAAPATGGDTSDSGGSAKADTSTDAKPAQSKDADGKASAASAARPATSKGKSGASKGAAAGKGTVAGKLRKSAARPSRAKPARKK
ncbi:MAG: zinc ribbon domain-containing protein [Steroidobacteraceae bacterium]